MDYEKLTKGYYENADGIIDDFAGLLNCFQAALYLILKTQHGIKKPYELFVQDFSFYIFLDKGGKLKNIDFYKRWSCFEVFKTRDVRGKGTETLSDIEQWLDKGEIVLFETHSHRVPFSQNYISLDYPYDEHTHDHTANHVFVALTHNDTDLFYVEAPPLLCSNFVPYQNSRCIGQIRKSDLKPAFDCFLNYRIVHVNRKELTKAFYTQRLFATLASIADNQSVPSAGKEDGTDYFNTRAIRALMVCFQENRINLGQKSPYHALTECQLLEWRFSLIRQQKYILQQALFNQASNINKNLEVCFETLRENTNLWETLVNHLRIMMRRNVYTPHRTLEILIKLESSESKLTYELSKLR